MLIFETENFFIESADRPHIDRNDGGHIRIFPKVPVNDRTKLSVRLAKELMKLTIVTGEAMRKVMNMHGVDVERINYQENGNWIPTLHIHLYGRARSAKVQKFGEAVYLPKRETGFYDNFNPLTKGDVEGLKEEIEKLLNSSYYKEFTL